MYTIPIAFWHHQSSPGWDIGAHEFLGIGASLPSEFDVAGAEYYAVAPAGYTYDATQNTNYASRKYNTLFDAEAALTATPATPLVINIIGDWTGSTDTTPVIISGVTTSASNYLLIRAIGVARHEGIWSLSKYRLYVSNDTCILLETKFCRFDGLLIGRSSSNANFQSGIRMNPLTGSTLNDIRISNCVIRQPGNNSYGECGVLINNNDAIVLLWNCIFYGTSIYGLSFNAGFAAPQAASVSAYSSTFIGGFNGFYSDATVNILKNCYGGGYRSYEGVSITKTNCGSSDAFGSIGFHNIPNDITTFVNVTPGSQDYKLVTGSSLIGVGAVTSGDASPLNFTTDITGKTRV